MSRHIAGVINPPAANKYGYVTGGEYPSDPETWLEQGEDHEGSWWTDWEKWVKRYNGGKKVPARTPGGEESDALEDAPGSYVKVRAG